MFSNIPIIIAFLILIHHFLKHRNDKNKTFFQKMFQIKDISNHESWVLFFFALGVCFFC